MASVKAPTRNRHVAAGRERHHRPRYVVVHREPRSGRDKPRRVHLDCDVDGCLARRQRHSHRQHQGEADDHASLHLDDDLDAGVARLSVRVLPRRPGVRLRHARGREFVRRERHPERERLRPRVALHPGQRRHARADGLHGHPHPLRREEVQLLGQPSDRSGPRPQRSARRRSSEAASTRAATLSRAARRRTRTSTPTPIRRRRATSRSPRSTRAGTRTPSRARPPAATTTRPIQRIRPTCPRIRAGYDATTFKNALFDNNSTRDTSLGNVDLLAFGSFDCRYYSSDGNPRRPARLDHREPRHPADLRHRLHRREPDRLTGIRRVSRPRQHLRQRHGLRSPVRRRSARRRSRAAPASATTRRAPTCSSSSRSTRVTQPTPSR